MTRRLALWLLASIAVHAALLSLVLALVGLSPRPLPVLFVDLVQGFLGAGERGRGTARDGEPPGAAAPGAPRGGEQRASARPPAVARQGAAAAPPGELERPHVAPVPRSTPDGAAVTVDPAPRIPDRPPQAPPPAVPPPPVVWTPPAVSPTPPAEPEVPRLAASAPGSPRPGADSPTGPGEGQSELPHGATDPGTRDGGGGHAASSGSGASAGIRDGGGGGSGDGRAGRAAAGEGAGSGPGAGDGLALAIPGDGGGPGREYDGYMSLLRRRLQEALAYPATARRRSLTGTVQIEMSILPTGEITQVAVAVSSSHRALDEAAVDAARQVGSVPFPPGIAPRALRVRLPVVFDLRARP